MTGPRLTVIATQTTLDTVSVEVKDSQNDTVGFLEITRTPNGAAVDSWNGDDSMNDTQVILRKRP